MLRQALVGVGTVGRVDAGPADDGAQGEGNDDGGRARGGSYRMPCPADQVVDLRVIVDHSIAEIFLTSTGQVLTLRCYPTGDGPWCLEIHNLAHTRLGYAVDAWKLLPLVIKEPSAYAEETQGRSAPRFAQAASVLTND
ncbi:GH32 C-terminal domain-containing protein [Streptomyces sp. IBSBF 2806]|uniref:GH32 C-terminal domain-containing protein n=1 Tax=Streptomyces sp. IBSBF 2806 TaxID=2903529 RepID=UPI002FDBAAC0